jgi:hypothetical protein
MRFTSEDGQKPDRAVVAEIKRIDPTIYPVWRIWHMDQITGAPLQTSDGRRFKNPQWYIVKECRDGRSRVLFTAPYLDGRVPRRLRADAGRHLRHQDINLILDEQAARAKERNEASYDQQQKDFIAANRKKLRTVFEGDNLKRPIRKRDEKIISYSKQTQHTSGRESIVPDSKELGFEVPWQEATNG